MLMTYDGIVVGRRDVGDNSCFVDIVTDQRGLIEANAHGVKKINSSLMSSTALFSYSTFCLSRGKSQYTINSAKPKYSFHEISSDVKKLALGSYFAQAVRYCTSSEQSQYVRGKTGAESLVRFLAVALYETINTEKTGRTLSAVKSTFELHYSSVLGFTPNLIGCNNCGEYECARGMYFLPDRGYLVCADCINPEYGGEAVLLREETLFAMRTVVFKPLSECFKFRISEKSERQLSNICERYFLRHTERSFTALEFYKTVK